MDKTEQNRLLRRVLIFGVIYAVAMLAVFLIVKREILNGWLHSVLSIFRPLIIGLILAYLANPFFRLFERRVLFRVHPSVLRRALSLILTYLSLFLIVALVLMMILPQMADSVKVFSENYRDYLTTGVEGINKALTSINGFVERWTENEETFNLLDPDVIEEKIGNWFTSVGGSESSDFTDTLLSATSTAWGVLVTVLSFTADSIFGILISIYLLAAKERHYAIIMRLRSILFSEQTNMRMTHFIDTADRSFGGFLKGKIVDSLIIGILTYIVVSIFRIPYAILVAAFVGVTNIIPVIGPIIGAIPTSFIILLAEPGKVIPFIIIVIIIQQLDGNVIGPKILGDNTGVSSLCVIIAITLMGSLWGFAGMLLGVPLFATVLALIEILTVKRLQEKGLPSGLQHYYAPDSVVDPVEDAHITTDKTALRFQKSVLRLRAEMERDPERVLKRSEKWKLRFFDFANRHHLFTKISDETLAQFCAEQTTRDENAAANAQFRAEYENSDLTSAERKQV